MCSFSYKEVVNINNQEDILKYAIENGMINLTYVQEKMAMDKRNEYLKKHQYDIWLASDGCWKTYLPDETKKNGRRLIKKKKKVDLENVVIEFIKEEECNGNLIVDKPKMTLEQLFIEWLNYKELHTNSSSYIKRITADWEKYYLPNVKMIKKPINKFTKIELDSWAHQLIKDKSLTKKQYYNMSVILRQSLDYAVENDYIDKNVFSEVKINSKMFRKVKKKQSETQVYTVDEVQRMICDMVRRFNNKPYDTAPLAVLLDFEIGVRVGELLALKVSDISPDWNTIHIQRQVVRVYDKCEKDGYKMRLTGYNVVEYTKSDDGDREVYLTEIAKKIIKLILYTNKRYGHECEDFLFVCGKKRINFYAINSRIRRGCETIGTITKTAHKIRKTYISTLIDSGLNIDEIRRQAGHSDERTTYNNYCFNRLNSTGTQKLIDDALKYDAFSFVEGEHPLITSNQEVINA